MSMTSGVSGGSRAPTADDLAQLGDATVDKFLQQAWGDMLKQNPIKGMDDND
jgi:phosphoribosylformylglycinamidine (FGAM) synthase-like enzyme